MAAEYIPDEKFMTYDNADLKFTALFRSLQVARQYVAQIYNIAASYPRSIEVSHTITECLGPYPLQQILATDYQRFHPCTRDSESKSPGAESSVSASIPVDDQRLQRLTITNSCGLQLQKLHLINKSFFTTSAFDEYVDGRHLAKEYRQATDNILVAASAWHGLFDGSTSGGTRIAMAIKPLLPDSYNMGTAVTLEICLVNDRQYLWAENFLLDGTRREISGASRVYTVTVRPVVVEEFVYCAAWKYNHNLESIKEYSEDFPHDAISLTDLPDNRFKTFMESLSHNSQNNDSKNSEMDCSQ